MLLLNLTIFITSLTAVAQANPLHYFETGLWGVTSTKNQPHPNASVTIATQQTLRQNPKNRIALDIRGKIDISQTNYHEFNLGIGQRMQLQNKGEGLIGYYGFWDITHIQDQVFMQQATLGLEWLDLTHHINANLYLPRTSFTTDLISPNASTPIRAINKNAFIVSDEELGLVSIKAPPGWDLQVEKSYPMHTNTSLLLQLGYQSFHKKDFISFQGPKVGIGIQQITGRNLNTVETFASHDSFYGTTLGLSFKTSRSPIKISHYTSLEKLYLRPIKRDIDVKIANLPTPSNADDFEEMKAREIEMINTLFNITVLHTNNSHDLEDRKQLLKDGLQFQEEAMVDGKQVNITKLLHRQYLTEEYALRTNKESVQKNLSHREIWKKNLSQDKPFLMVIEDQLLIKAELYERLTQFLYEKNHLDHDIIFPGHNPQNPTQPVAGTYITQTTALPKLIRETRTWHDDLAIHLIDPKHNIVCRYTEQNWF